MPLSQPRFRRQFVGRPLVDAEGVEIGRIADTWPLDGSGSPEMALVKVRNGRFTRDKFVPLDGITELNGYLFAPFSRHDVDAAPDADNYGWGDPGTLARTHWSTVAPITSAD